MTSHTIGRARSASTVDPISGSTEFPSLGVGALYPRSKTDLASPRSGQLRLGWGGRPDLREVSRAHSSVPGPARIAERQRGVSTANRVGRRSTERTECHASGGQDLRPWTRIVPPAARTTRPGPGPPGSHGPRTRPPARHHRPPDRARVAKVVRPAGRSTFTTRAQPGRAKPARREALSTGEPAHVSVDAVVDQNGRSTDMKRLRR